MLIFCRGSPTQLVQPAKDPLITGVEPNPAEANVFSRETDLIARFLINNSVFQETDSVQNQVNFNAFPSDFSQGITIRNDSCAVRQGGYVKADLIRDFRAIDSTDFFDPHGSQFHLPTHRIDIYRNRGAVGASRQSKWVGSRRKSSHGELWILTAVIDERLIERVRR